MRDLTITELTPFPLVMAKKCRGYTPPEEGWKAYFRRGLIQPWEPVKNIAAMPIIYTDEDSALRAAAFELKMQSPRFTNAGRVILADGEPILIVPRPGPGDGMSPNEADMFAQIIARALNGHSPARAFLDALKATR